MYELETKAEFLGANVTLKIVIDGYTDQDLETREIERKFQIDQLWIIGDDIKPINVYPLLLESEEMQEYVNELILENH